MTQTAPLAAPGWKDPFAPVDHPLGRRIAIVGSGGKTTLARALGVRLGLPVIELDALFWLPGWQESSVEDFREKVARAMAEAPGGWVVDGGYTGSLGDLVLRQADTVVWLNMPWRVMFWRILLRTLRRAWDKERICGDNYESWRQAFFSRKSILWWHIREPGHYRRQGLKLALRVPPGTPVVRLSSARELERFYEANGLARPWRMAGRGLTRDEMRS